MSEHRTNKPEWRFYLSCDVDLQVLYHNLQPPSASCPSSPSTPPALLTC